MRCKGTVSRSQGLRLSLLQCPRRSRQTVHSLRQGEVHTTGRRSGQDGLCRWDSGVCRLCGFAFKFSMFHDSCGGIRRAYPSRGLANRNFHHAPPRYDDYSLLDGWTNSQQPFEGWIPVPIHWVESLSSLCLVRCAFTVVNFSRPSQSSSIFFGQPSLTNYQSARIEIAIAIVHHPRIVVTR